MAKASKEAIEKKRAELEKVQKELARLEAEAKREAPAQCAEKILSAQNNYSIPEDDDSLSFLEWIETRYKGIKVYKGGKKTFTVGRLKTIARICEALHPPIYSYISIDMGERDVNVNTVVIHDPFRGNNIRLKAQIAETENYADLKIAGLTLTDEDLYWEVTLPCEIGDNALSFLANIKSHILHCAEQIRTSYEENYSELRNDYEQVKKLCE